MENLPLVSIVLPTYNRLEFIKKSVRSLLAQTYPSDLYEIIVVDDGSDYDIAEALKEFTKIGSSKITIIKQPINRGIGAARQKGLEAARGGLVAFTDDDCVYHKDWLLELVRNLDEFAGVGGRVAVSDDFNFFQKLLATNLNKCGPRIENGRVISIAGNSSLYHKNILFEVNGFSKDLSGNEDRDLNIRIRRKGYELTVAENALCYHYPKRTLGEFIRWRFKLGRLLLQTWKRCPDAYPNDFRSIMNSRPFNPLFLFCFPYNIVRIFCDMITFVPALLILLVLFFLYKINVPEESLLKLFGKNIARWCLRSINRQSTDFGVLVARLSHYNNL
ncbi:MAG: glycosyltransferase [Candidatus Omnitrophica bacterium]|nr:glycosyltransferase [Candidatus Omnitrophota bacterium]